MKQVLLRSHFLGEEDVAPGGYLTCSGHTAELAFSPRASPQHQGRSLSVIIS